MRRSFLALFPVLALLLVLAFAAGLPAGAAPAAQKRPPAVPLDLNSATAEQLVTLPGIGPTAARAIVEFRTKSGPFRRVEDLLAIRGISARKLEQLRPHVTVAPAKPVKPSPSAPKPGGTA